MARRRALAQRIVVAIRTLTLVLGGVFAVAVIGVVHWVEHDVVNATLEQELGTAIAHYREHGHWPHLVPGTRIYGEGLTSPPPIDFAALPDGFSEQSLGAEDFYVVRRDIDGRRYLLVRDQTEFEDQERMLVAGLAGAWLASVLLAWLIGHFTARQVMDPVIDLARRVRRREQLHALAPPLAPDYADDEVGQLAAAFDATLGELRAALERERLFTSDVSHELRTPLMVVTTSAELLASRSTEPRAQALLQRIAGAAAEMDELVQTFLLLARAQGGQTLTGDGVSVGAVAREQAERWAPALREKGLDFTLELAGEPAGRYPAVLLRVAIGNLLRNAAHHTERGSIALRVDAGGISVEDSGSGLPPEVRAALFQPFVQGEAARAAGQGLGLGLSLVRRVAAAAGWHIRLDDRAEGGTHARIDMA